MLSIPALSTHRIRTVLALLGASAALSAVAATPALANHSELVFFEAPRQLYLPSTRAKTFAQLRTLGVKALRVELHWAQVAPSPNSARRPKFDATNPASYDFYEYDAMSPKPTA